MKKALSICGLFLGLVIASLAFVNEQNFTTPATTNTASVMSVSLSNSGFTNANTSGVKLIGIVQRAIMQVPNGLSTPATGSLYVVDFDGTVLFSTGALTNSRVISGTVTSYVGQVISTNVTWYAFQPSIVMSNQSTTNLSGTATFTFQQ